MPFPFVFHENFELGTKGDFTTEFTDTAGKLDFPDHHDDLDIPPWRGGYVMRCALDRAIDAAYVEQTSALNISSGTTRYIRFMLRTSPDFRLPHILGASGGSSVKVFSVWSASVEEFAIGISRSDSNTRTARLAIYSPDDNEFIDGLEFDNDVWLPIECTIAHGGTTSTRVYLHLGENTVQSSRMNFAPLTHFRLGAMAQTPHVRGTIYFDDFIIDTAKLEEPTFVAPEDLWGESMLYTKMSYAFVGPGSIRGATLIGGGSDNVAYLYDADRLPLAHHDIRAALKVAAAESKDTLIETVRFNRGCYVRMEGTNPQVIVHYGARG